MRRRLIALLVAAVAVVAVVTVGVTIALGNDRTPPPATSTTAARPDRNFAVAAPGSSVLRGGDPPQVLPCRASAIATSATTRRAADGVIGLISLRGRGCGLMVSPIRLRLLGPTGLPLLVANAEGNPVNAAFSVRPDIVEGAGSVRVGFAWNGSYCGPPAQAVSIDVFGQPFPIPLRGPAPKCILGLTSSLVPGVVDGPGAAVVPAPVSWDALRARVVLPKTVPRGPVPLTVQLTNSSSRDVSLAEPCPTYQVRLTYILNFATTTGLSHGDLCDRPLTVKAGSSLTLELGRLTAPGLSGSDEGDLETVRFSMAGVELATAATYVQ